MVAPRFLPLLEAHGATGFFNSDHYTEGVTVTDTGQRGMYAGIFGSCDTHQFFGGLAALDRYEPTYRIPTRSGAVSAGGTGGRPVCGCMHAAGILFFGEYAVADGESTADGNRCFWLFS